MTYFPLAPLALLGDVPVETPPEIPAWVLYVGPALAWFLFSTFVAALNDVLRQRDAEGVSVSPPRATLRAVCFPAR